MMETDDYSPVVPKDTVNAAESEDGEDEDWREKLNRDDTFASVRDVKNASAKCVICGFSLYRLSCTDSPVFRSFKVMYPRVNTFIMSYAFHS